MYCTREFTNTTLLQYFHSILVIIRTANRRKKTESARHKKTESVRHKKTESVPCPRTIPLKVRRQKVREGEEESFTSSNPVKCSLLMDAVSALKDMGRYGIQDKSRHLAVFARIIDFQVNRSSLIPTHTVCYMDH